MEMVYQNFMLHVRPELEKAMVLKDDCGLDMYVSGGGVKNKAIMM